MSGSIPYEKIIRYAIWHKSRRSTPTWREIADYFGVSRAAAHRWLRAFKDATGQA